MGSRRGQRSAALPYSGWPAVSKLPNASKTQSERLILKAVFNVDSQQQQERIEWAENAGKLQGPMGGPPLLPPLTPTAAGRLMHQTADLLYDIKAWAAAKGHYNGSTAVAASRGELAALHGKVPWEPEVRHWTPPPPERPPPAPYSEEAQAANEAAAKARWCVSQLQRYFTEYHRCVLVIACAGGNVGSTGTPSETGALTPRYPHSASH